MDKIYGDIYKAAKSKWDGIAKPIDSLGVLEDDVAKLCAINGSAEPPKLKRRALLVFGADHGVVKEGVTQTDSSVTRTVMENFCTGKACTAIMAEMADCDVYPIDIGMLPDKAERADCDVYPIDIGMLPDKAERADCDVYPIDIGMLPDKAETDYDSAKIPSSQDELYELSKYSDNSDVDITLCKTGGIDISACNNENNAKKFENGCSLHKHEINNFNIRPGTGDILVEDAMTPSECLDAISTGMTLVEELKNNGYDIVLTGEMGIGNTTPTSVLSALFLGKPAEELTGRGAGLDDNGYKRKIEVVNGTILRVTKNYTSSGLNLSNSLIDNKFLELDSNNSLNDNKFLELDSSNSLNDNKFLELDSNNSLIGDNNSIELNPSDSLDSEVANESISRVRKNIESVGFNLCDSLLGDYKSTEQNSGNSLIDNNKANDLLNDKNKSYIFEKINSSENAKRAFYYLYSAGGLEIAAMTGVFLGAEKYRIPAVADGVISLVSALIASEISVSAKDFILASHFPKEKAGQIILSVLDIAPVIDAKLALGEGSGGVLSLPLLDMAIDVYQKMGTFEDFDIEKYQRFEKNNS